MRLASVGALAVAVLVGGCSTRSTRVTCPDGVCPTGTTCFRGLCVLPEDAHEVADDDAWSADAGQVSDSSRLDAYSIAFDAADAPASADAGSPIDLGPVDAFAPPDAFAYYEGDAGIVSPPGPPPPLDTGPVLDPPPTGVLSMPDGLADVVLDWERHRVYATRPAAGAIDVLDLVSGSMTVLGTGHQPQRLDFDPVLDEVVAVATQWSANGYLVVVDAVGVMAGPLIPLGMDPWDVAADGRGSAWVTPGSGWSEPVAVELATGAVTIGSGLEVYGHTSIELHPWRDRAYGVSGAISSMQIIRFESTGGIHVAYEGPFSGCACDTLRLHPAGYEIYGSAGTIFAATEVHSTDATQIGTLGTSWVDLAFGPDGSRAYVIHAATSSTLDVVDTTTRMSTLTVPLALPATRVLAGLTYLVVLAPMGGATPTTRVDVLPYP